MQEIGFDIISDLNLKSTDDFNWDGKATSLYCIVAGNISSDMNILVKVLINLTRIYQGVFFVPGKLEYENATNISKRTEDLDLISSSIPNLCMLHQQVVVIDGVAVLGTNGWGNIENESSLQSVIEASARLEDYQYLRKTLAKLQRHLDVKKIIIVTNAVPHPDLYFKELSFELDDQMPLHDCLSVDTEHKVTTWVFGTYLKQVDTYINNLNYLNNPCINESPYWPKRLTILI